MAHSYIRICVATQQYKILIILILAWHIGFCNFIEIPIGQV